MRNDKRGGGEIFEALNEVYSADEMQQILGTTQWHTDLPTSDLVRRINSAANWYTPYRRVLNEGSRPSERERRLKKVRDKLRAGATAVRYLQSSDYDYLRSAGERLAKSDGTLPDIEAERVALPLRPDQTEPDSMAIWDAAQQIEASLQRLDWLVRCIEAAIERTQQEKAAYGSMGADDALHTTIRLLHKVYFDFAKDPRMPGADIGDDSAESLTYRKSELLDFFEAALRPFGITKSREAIYMDWRRAQHVIDVLEQTGKQRSQRRRQQGMGADPLKDA